MKITILTLFPDMVSSFFRESIMKRAVEQDRAQIEFINIRNYALDSYGTVDGKSYGGGTGMVLRIEPVFQALEESKKNSQSKKRKVIMTSPRGVKFTQEKAIEYSQYDELVILSGHYESIDERVTEYIDEEVSLGDFVLTGGEIVAAAITDAVVRLLPGVLKKEDATINESFFTVTLDDLLKAVGKNKVLEQLKEKGINSVTLLEYPHYTRPEEFNNMKVPDMLLSGNHEEISKWRLQKAFEETLKRRPDLLLNTTN